MPSSFGRYVPAVGPRLRWLMAGVFVLSAVIGVNSFYLSGVSLLEWISEQSGEGYIYQDYFYLWMMLGHLGLGLLLMVPFAIFVTIHLFTARTRPNRRAIQMGYALLGACLSLLITGILLMGVDAYELKHPVYRRLAYWIHVLSPFVILWLYLLHRLAGPRIRWRVGLSYLSLMGAIGGALVYMQSLDPREWNTVGPAEGNDYFRPSLAQTAKAKFISSDVLLMDQYCMKCHPDAYHGWFHSAHHFSSFNNPMYLASVRETRETALKRDGSVRASRWCAGCHDPVPMFSGAFDDPKFDDVNHRTAQAGITCTVCHAITHVNSTRGNGDYTIEEPLHYPFAQSKNPWLQSINQLLVKSKPAFHKKTFLKPLHKTEEFCSTCHKVHLPAELTHYKEFLRGQNHYDSFRLSGASGHGSRSNYYGRWAAENCASCHMPLQKSNDFGAKVLVDRDRPDLNQLSIHNHLFPGGNTALPYLRDEPEIVEAQQTFLKSAVRLELFGLREGDAIDGKLHEEIRPYNEYLKPGIPTLKPGRNYLLETVVRNSKVGHELTQGTADSNELWLEVTVAVGDRIVLHSGFVNERGEVDPDAHFINAYVLDRNGKRIDRRNPQDIFTVLYNHQIPPGSSQVVRHRLDVPDDVDDLVTVEVKLQYRKFDQKYMEFVTRTAKKGDLPIRGHTPGQPYLNTLPITTMATDKVTFPVEGVDKPAPEQEYEIFKDFAFMRRNDYGLAMLGQGNGLPSYGNRSADLIAADQAFRWFRDKSSRIDVRMNLARTLMMEGKFAEAVEMMIEVVNTPKPMFLGNPVYAPWTINWLNGVLNHKVGNFDAAIANFNIILKEKTDEMIERGYIFSKDDLVRNELGRALFAKARQVDKPESRKELLLEAVSQFKATLENDAENATAHYNLGLLYRRLGDEERAKQHRELHLKYRLDDVAYASRQQQARRENPAANRAAEGIVIYPLKPVAADARLSADGATINPSSKTATAAAESDRSSDR